MIRSGPVIETIKSIILDFQESRLETGVPRRLRIETVPGKAAVCIGVRRSGKSTYLFQVIQRLLASGVSRQNILYLNFFDDRLHNLRQDNLGLIAEAYYSIYPEKKNTETVYCFFDEIQAASGWEPFVERMMRTEKCEVYLTGSSARMLSREIATQMRGRALSWEMFPFSFREFLDCKEIDSEGALSTKKRLLVQKGFEAFWESGGFPEAAGLGRNLRIKTHQEYFHTILFRDLVERHDVSHPKAVTDLAHWLVDNTASLYSVNSLTGYLKSLGHKAPKSAVADYLEWFEDAYFLFTVRLFDPSLARSNTNPKKVSVSITPWSPRCRPAFSSIPAISSKTSCSRPFAVCTRRFTITRPGPVGRSISSCPCVAGRGCWSRCASPWRSRKRGNGRSRP